MEKFENKRGVFKKISDTILDDYYAEDSEIEDDEDVHSEEDAEMNNNMQKEGKAKQKAKQAKIAAAEKAAQEEILKKKMETFINRTVDSTLRNKDDFNLPAMSSSSMVSKNEYDKLLCKVEKLQKENSSLKTKYNYVNERLNTLQILNERLQMKLLLSNEEDISHKGKSVQLPSHKNGLQIKKDVLGAKETDVAGSSIAKSDTSPERANVRQLLTKSFIDGFEKCNKSTPLTTPQSQKTWNELPNEGNNTFIQSPNKWNNLLCKNDSIIEAAYFPINEDVTPQKSKNYPSHESIKHLRKQLFNNSLTQNENCKESDTNNKIKKNKMNNAQIKEKKDNRKRKNTESEDEKDGKIEKTEKKSNKKARTEKKQFGSKSEDDATYSEKETEKEKKRE
ncbi:uncharacterized protein [Temnothorax nylanderi]|uniref:uncharacterized protein n=1 Tax=Temnothorax nylanderi TaxID=102681 RepID=UPI003A8C2522